MRSTPHQQPLFHSLASLWRRWRWVLLALILVCAALAAAPFVLRWWIDRRYKVSIYDIEDAPPRRVAIVFGAGLTADGRPQPALADRIWTAAELYKAGKAQKLLMSGDNRFVDYNNAMTPRSVSEWISLLQAHESGSRGAGNWTLLNSHLLLLPQNRVLTETHNAGLTCVYQSSG